jgi:hypothetical protein
MDINASIIDQRVEGLLDAHRELLPGNSDEHKKSAAFVLLCVMAKLELNAESALDCVTEGSGDAGVDALYVADPDDGEFQVTIFQAKYRKDLSGNANFPARGVEKAIYTTQTLFDPRSNLNVNDLLRPKLEEIRALIQDGFIPNVRIVLANNGIKWNSEAQASIDNVGFPEEQVSWIHVNHNDLVSILQNQKSVDDAIQLHGEVVIEEFNYRRVLIGKIPIQNLADLFNRHGDRLLERNIRRYLGLNRNRVNTAIHETLKDPAKRDNFYFYNNGVTMICSKFRRNALQGRDFQLHLEGIQVINGGQTCKTIQQTLKELEGDVDFSGTFVLLRLYELSEDDTNFVHDITYATNSQNPVDLRDLRANDEVQRKLELGMKDLGFMYRRKRDDTSAKANELTSAVVGESALAIWRQRPNQAKFRRKEIFGKLYDSIFNDLSATQAIIGALIFRKVENERKRPEQDNPPAFLPYASHYKSMLIGQYLLAYLGISIGQISHQNFDDLRLALDKYFPLFQKQAQQAIEEALERNYGKRDITLQQLSATFRRGDLLEYLLEA